MPDQNLRSFSHGDSVTAVLLGCSAAILFAIVAHKDTFLNVTSDAAVYLLLAEHVSPWHTVGDSLAGHLLTTYPFPPLFPVVLAMLGGGAAAPITSFLLGAVFFAAAIALTYLWMRHEGASPTSSGCAALIFGLTPTVWLHLMGIYSEPLYIVLFLAGLLLVPRGPAASSWLLPGLCFGLAALTRSVGLFAVAAFVVVWLKNTRGRSGWLGIVVATGLPALWWLIKTANGWTGSYFKTITQGGSESILSRLAHQLPHNIEALWHHVLRSFDILGSGYAAIVITVVCMLALIGWSARLRSLQLDAVYLGLYVAVILSWPFPNDFQRLLLPLLPLVLFYAFKGLATATSSLSSLKLNKICDIALATALLLVTLPSSGSMWLQIAQFQNVPERNYVRTGAWYGHDSQAEALTALAFEDRVRAMFAEAASKVPEEACVSSTFPGLVHLQMRRESVHLPTPAAGTDALLETVRRCPYVTIVAAAPTPPMGYGPFYPSTEIGSRLQVLYAAEGDGAHAGQTIFLLARYIPSVN